MQKFFKRNSSTINSVSSILLATMAIIVSVKSCQIAEYQNTLAEIEYQPHIKVESELQFDPETKTFPKQIIIVSNEENIVTNVEADYHTFLQIQLILPAGKGEHKVIIPIIGYFDFRTHTNNSKDVLYTFQPDDNINNLKIISLMVETQNLQIEEMYQFHHLELVTFAVVSFTNKLGRRQTQYYRVGSSYGIEVPEKDLLEFRNGESTMAGMLDFDDLTMDHIKSIIFEKHKASLVID